MTDYLDNDDLTENTQEDKLLGVKILEEELGIVKGADLEKYPIAEPLENSTLTLLRDVQNVLTRCLKPTHIDQCRSVLDRVNAAIRTLGG